MTDSFEENDARERAFMQHLGEAITAWQEVEQAVWGVYLTFMRGADPKLISVSFFHIQSFDARVGLVNRCAYFGLLDGAPKERWTKLWKRIEKQSAIRNQLVHFAYIIEGRGYHHTPTLGPSSVDATAVIRKRARNPDYRIDSTRLGRIRHDFETLARDIRVFVTEMDSMVRKTS